ncbi:hypothetical protein M409DRAFT_52777 [Zasmidium cellare ATCC 36951]|uniref:Uncharacterized protein n=1 Tax=Zasmidium cellare ATCC 36951 TaxID=1080233 RepID=A0A6A6CNQ8_ZASCE|nr:uncharacterized protein M409DRAFT_52777 [Zasmidium cellare ATCC 36951]KAF2168755.1 hypothetical protein M409DRAFT_52777 [Zasmidium cellare ATCC 36951]
MAGRYCGVSATPEPADAGKCGTASHQLTGYFDKHVFAILTRYTLTDVPIAGLFFPSSSKILLPRDLNRFHSFGPKRARTFGMKPREKSDLTGYCGKFQLSKD